jgi:hypothetical protein
MIKQAELRQYRDDQAELRRLESALSLKRAELIRRIDEGEPPQKGVLRPTILETASRRFSAEGVAAVLGAEATAKIREQLPETIARSLKILEA